MVAAPVYYSMTRADEERELILRAYRSSTLKMGVVEVLPDDLRIVSCNPAAAELLALGSSDAPDTCRGHGPLPPDLLELWLESCLDAWRNHAQTSFEITDPRTDPPRRLAFTVDPLAEDGVADRWLCSFLIDEVAGTPAPAAAPATSAAPAAAEGEAHFRHIADTVPVLIWTSDVQGRRDYFNRSWLELTGGRLADMTGDGWIERVHPDDREACREVLLDALHGREAFRLEYRLRRHDGTWRWMLDTGAPRLRSDGRFLGHAGSCVDITDHRRTELRLRRSERWHRELIEGTDNLVMQIDGEGRLSFVNQVSRGVYDAEPEECVGFPFLDFVHPEDRDETRRRFERWKNGGYGCVTFENRQIGRSGEVRDVLWTVNPHYDAEGRMASANCIGQDVTERKRSERVHKIQSQVLESMTEGVVLTNAQGFILYTNPAQDEMFGYEPGELIGQHVHVLGGAAEEAEAGEMARALATDGSWTGELVQRRKSGADLVCAVRANTIDIDGTAHWVSVFQDVTLSKQAEEERRRLDQRLQQAQKLESLGVLAGGIAHDFNNLLMVILGNASLALQDLDPFASAHSDIEQIESAAMRAAELTKQMLAYSGKGQFMVEPTDLSQVVAEMEQLIAGSLPKAASLRFEIAEDLPKVEVDVAQVRQLVMNLVANACEALDEDGGTITVSTGYHHYRRGDLEEASLAEELPAGCYAYLRVRDDGVGMDEDVRSKVFDPFFTTKFTGRGLGLAAVLGIVRGHRGGIRIESRPGEGSSFTVLLPACAPPPAPAIEAEPAADRLSTDGTVLVVDDDANVLTMAGRMFERLGFEVLAAESGAEAVELYREHQDEIVLVLLDMTMPRMDGEETFRRLRQVRDDVCVVLSSGYTEEIAVERFEGLGLAGFLQKPYRQGDLVSKLDEVLNLAS